MINSYNPILSLLIDLNICQKDSIVEYHNKVRDRDDIKVLKCKKSGVLFLSKVDHISKLYYKEKTIKYWNVTKRREAINKTYRDDYRRAKQFKKLITNKKWLDVGTGAGGILDLLKNNAKEVFAVEPQDYIREELKKLNYNIFSSIDELKDDYFETITLFHVLEHFLRPIEHLRLLNGKLANQGKIIIEVPHANDFLISFLELKEFKDFTFWSEHLILHTKESSKIFLEEAGFKNILICGYQRYPIANHLYWLSKKKPGGHKVWNFLSSDSLDEEYCKLLASLNMTDTLIAIAEK